MGVSSRKVRAPQRLNMAMNPESTVAHMRDFILHEAQEKKNEIMCKAIEDYTLEKQRLTEEEKLRIKKEFERREKNVALDAKIANATETNKSKLLVLAAAADEVDQSFKMAMERLRDLVADQSKYSELLVELIIQ